MNVRIGGGAAVCAITLEEMTLEDTTLESKAAARREKANDGERMKSSRFGRYDRQRCARCSHPAEPIVLATEAVINPSGWRLFRGGGKLLSSPSVCETSGLGDLLFNGILQFHARHTGRGSV
jgi:hypothetical protein